MGEDGRATAPASPFTSLGTFVGALLLLVGLYFLGQLNYISTMCRYGVSNCFPYAQWQYGYATATRGAIYAAAGGVTLLAGFVLIRRWGRQTKVIAQAPRPRRRVVASALSIVGVVLLCAAVAVSFAPPPARSWSFANSDLQVVYQSNNLTERVATVHAARGEVIEAYYAVNWYVNGSTTPVWFGGTVAQIEPAGAVVNWSSSRFAEGYTVPQDGDYMVWFQANACCLRGNVTTLAWLNGTAYNPILYPPIQLATALVGGVVFSAAVVAYRMVDRRRKSGTAV